MILPKAPQKTAILMDIQKRSLGFLYGSDWHYLDHLAPFCSLLSIPLVVTDNHVLIMAQRFYPSLVVTYLSPLSFSQNLCSLCDILFTCLPKGYIELLFFFEQLQHKKKLLTIWLPHGNSDKDNLEGLANETMILSYGKQMKDRLQEKNLLKKLFQLISIGNFRSLFFYKQLPFYTKQVFPKITFPKNRQTILFAPTWNATPIEKTVKELLEKLPQAYNVLIKLHPNSLHNPNIFSIQERYRKNASIKFIDKIPTIFPILSTVDILITDASSIAYDFLFFDRPIFFLNAQNTPMTKTGYRSSPTTLCQDLVKPDLFQEARKSLYLYAFSQTCSEKMLIQKIEAACKRYFAL